MFALVMRADMVAGAVVVGAVDPEAAGADPEGPAAGVVVEGEAICRDDICCRGAISNSAL